MPELDKFKVRLTNEHGTFLGYGCLICEAMGKKFEVLKSGFRGCGEIASSGVSNHILKKHQATLQRGFILHCDDCLTKLICHEPNKGMNPEDCPYFNRLRGMNKCQ